MRLASLRSETGRWYRGKGARRGLASSGGRTAGDEVAAVGRKGCIVYASRIRRRPVGISRFTCVFHLSSWGVALASSTYDPPSNGRASNDVTGSPRFPLVPSYRRGTTDRCLYFIILLTYRAASMHAPFLLLRPDASASPTLRVALPPRGWRSSGENASPTILLRSRALSPYRRLLPRHAFPRNLEPFGSRGAHSPRNGSRVLFDARENRKYRVRCGERFSARRTARPLLLLG